MQVKETVSEGLKRELQVVVGVAELNERFSARLNDMKDRVQLKGFRRGKVPVAHIKKVYGKAMMVEVLEEAVKETSAMALKEREERPAFHPEIVLPKDEIEIAKVIDGQADLSYSMSFEVLPKVAVTDFSNLKLERLVADVADAEVDEALQQLLDSNVAYEEDAGRAAESGDRVKIDFVGRIDGEVFEGGSAEGVDLVLGTGQFIPGFEDQLVGLKAGEERQIAVSFPEGYGAAHLAGKPATFDIKAISISKPKAQEASDEFATSLGVESLDKLKELLKGRIAGEFAQASRIKLKRDLLDALDTSHDFELPTSLVGREFEQIWGQLTKSLEREGKTFADEGKSEEETRQEYQRIAARRVRLGLLIGEIGDKNKIEVSQDELRRALAQQVRQFPGQERMVYEYFEKSPGALTELRAPIFEEKVVDFILDLANPIEKKVSKEELLKAARGAEEDGEA